MDQRLLVVFIVFVRVIGRIRGRVQCAFLSVYREEPSLSLTRAFFSPSPPRDCRFPNLQQMALFRHFSSYRSWQAPALTLNRSLHSWSVVAWMILPNQRFGQRLKPVCAFCVETRLQSCSFFILRSFDGAVFCLTAAGYIRIVRQIADPLCFGHRILPRDPRGKRHCYVDSCPVFDSREPHENRILMIAFPAPKKIS